MLWQRQQRQACYRQRDKCYRRAKASLDFNNCAASCLPVWCGWEDYVDERRVTIGLRREQHRWSAPNRWLDIQVRSMALAALARAIASRWQQYGDFCGRFIEKEWATL